MTTEAIRPAIMHEQYFESHGHVWDRPCRPVCLSYRITGDLSVDALRRALADLPALHDALRWSFQVEDSRLTAAVAESATIPLLVADRSDLDEALDLLRESVVDAIAPAVAPLARAGVVRLGPSDHVFVLAVDHRVADGRSAARLLEDLCERYDEHRRGVAGPPAVRAKQFSVWSVEQRQALDPAEMARLVEFWRSHVGVTPEPARNPLPAFGHDAESDRLHTTRVELPMGFAGSAGKFAADHGVTPFAVYAGILLAATRSLSGADSCVITMNCANRDLDEDESVVGMCTTEIYVRTALDGDTAELAEGFLESLFDCLDHASCPPRLVTRTVWPEADLYGQGLLILATAALDNPLPLAGVRAEPVAFRSEAGMGASLLVRVLADRDPSVALLHCSADADRIATTEALGARYLAVAQDLMRSVG